MNARRTALITGAAGGIGAALARALAPDHDLILHARRRDRLEPLLEAFPGARALIADLERPERLAAAAAALELPRLHALVHNAGIAELGAVADTPLDVWTRSLTVNAAAPAELTRALLPAVRAARGHVVFVNSGAGLHAGAGWAPYAASKFALRALADALRLEEAERGVRVTTVYPGRTATVMQRRVRDQEGGDYDEAAYARAESVAATVRWALDAPGDAAITEITVRPAPR